MIGRITGKLLVKQPPQIIVDVNGVGYEIDVPMSTLYQLPGDPSPDAADALACAICHAHGGLGYGGVGIGKRRRRGRLG